MKIINMSFLAAGTAVLLAWGASSHFGGRDAPLTPAPSAGAQSGSTIETAVFAVG